MRRRRKYTKPRRPRRTLNEASKAKSLQGAWRKATDKTGTLTMAEAKIIVADPPDCPYCGLKIPYPDISIDHVQPRSKGGTSTADNLVYCDRQCNFAKGDLTGPEFKALMDFLKEHPTIKETILKRLIAGSARIFGRRRRR